MESIASEWELGGWIPVLSHPLSATRRGLRREEPSAKDPTNDEAVKDAVAFDPLGVAVTPNSSVENGCVGGAASATIADELATGGLDNTLKLGDVGKSAGKFDGGEQELDPVLPGFRPWSQFQDRIISICTTNESLSMESSFLPPPTTRDGGDYSRRPNTSAASNARQRQQRNGNRVAVNEKGVALHTFHDLTQAEYVGKIEDLRRILDFKWRQERRLECIQLVVETTRLLSTVNSTPLHFYPAQFVHITSRVLDHFGQIVYERLRRRADLERSQAKLAPLSDNFHIHDVLEQTRITARNWFGRVGDIREAVPRIYIEAALLRCMAFMDPSSVAANLIRLCEIVKSLHHPVISAYARLYLCRVALRLDAQDRSVPWRCLNDWMQTPATTAAERQPIALLRPALEWVVQCVAVNAVSYEDCSPLWEYCRLAERRPLVLCPVLDSLPAPYLAEHALEACRIVVGSELVTADEVCALGRNLLRRGVAEVMGAATSRSVLRAVWKCIQRMQSPKSFLQCAEVWVEFVARHFTVKEIHIVLEQLLRRMNNEKEHVEPFMPHLQSLLAKMVGAVGDVAELLRMDLFPQLVDLLFRTQHTGRKESAHAILTAFTQRHAIGEFHNAVHLGLGHQVLDIAKRADDALESIASSVEEVEELKQHSRLIAAAIDRFHFDGENPEQALDFYVACRVALLNNDQLQRYVCLRILHLATHVTRSARFSSARCNFLQTCLANLFITIPSLPEPAQRLALALQSAHVSLAAMAYLQLDAFMDFILETFAHYPPERCRELESSGAQFLSLLHALPRVDGGGVGPLTRLRRFVEILRSFEWPITAVSTHASLLLSCLQFLLAIYSREHQWPFFEQPSGDNGDDDDTGDTLAILEMESTIAGALHSLLGEAPDSSLVEVEVRLLELISIYSSAQDGGGDIELSDELRALAKQLYKQCKKRVSAGSANIQLQRRLDLLKAGRQ